MLTKCTSFQNEGQPARVVFDVSQQGSALKVITLRSALIVNNQLDGPIDLRMENPIIPGKLFCIWPMSD